MTSSITAIAGALLLASGLLLPCDARAGAAFRPIFSSRSTYGESYSFIADLDDGTYVHATLAVTNLGPGGLKGVCAAVVRAKDGTLWRGSTRVGRDAIRLEPRTERLTIGRCAAWATAQATSVELQLEEGALRLDFAAAPSERSPHDTVVVVNGDLFRDDVLLYRTPLTAHLTLGKQPPRTSSGSGYLDHSRGTIPPKDLGRRWVRFRALRGARGLLLIGRQACDGSFGPLWACSGPESCRDFRSFDLARAGSPQGPSYTVKLQAETAPDLLIHASQLLYRDAPIEELGLIGKLVAPFTGSPVTYTYRATATLPGAEPVEGILEVEVDFE